MAEDRIFLLGNSNPAEVARQIGEIPHFDTRDIVEIAGIVGVAAYTIGNWPHPLRNVGHRLVKPMPLAWNGGARLAVVALTDAGHQQWLAGLETRRLKIVDPGGIHGDRLLKSEMVERRRTADHLGCHPEMIAKRAGEGFVRAIVRLQRQRQDVRRTAG
jgi:hypothetical protein